MSDKIIRELEQRLRAGEDTGPLRFDLGSAYLEDDNLDKAAEHLQAAIKHEPDYAVAWMRLGRVHQALGRVEQARDAFENGLGAAEKYGYIGTANELRDLINRLNRGG